LTYDYVERASNLSRRLAGTHDTVAEWIYHLDFVQQLIGVDCQLAEVLDNNLVAI